MEYITLNFDAAIKVTPDNFINALCEVHQINTEELRSRSRKAKIINAKSAGAYILRQYANLTFDKIARIFGDATIQNARYHYKTVSFRLKQNTGGHYRINKIKGELIYGSYLDTINNLSLESLVGLSVNWGKARGLDDIKSQSMKLSEEVGELMSSILKNDYAKQVDAVGDILVVLSILSYQLGFSLTDAFSEAYNTISNRKGKTVNGSFIKEEDEL